MKRNIEIGKQTYEIGSLISFGININKPLLKPINIDMIVMTKDKHHELQVRSVCTLGHQSLGHSLEHLSQLTDGLYKTIILCF